MPPGKKYNLNLYRITYNDPSFIRYGGEDPTPWINCILWDMCKRFVIANMKFLIQVWYIVLSSVCADMILLIGNKDGSIVMHYSLLLLRLTEDQWNWHNGSFNWECVSSTLSLPFHNKKEYEFWRQCWNSLVWLAISCFLI